MRMGAPKISKTSAHNHKQQESEVNGAISKQILQIVLPLDKY